MEKIEKHGVHEALRYKGTVIADCGAFSYIKEDEPPFTTKELLEYYDSCGFDVGATMDHLIIGQIKKDEDERKRRYEITLKNAEKMWLEWRQKYSDRYKLMGAVQGWDPKSYADAAEHLISLGFDYIGIGGLAGASTKKITATLKEVDSRKKRIVSDAKIHVFGVSPIRQGSFDLLKALKMYDVYSIDTSIMLRQAWSRVDSNYLLGTEQFTALRVPMVLEDEIAATILQDIRAYADSRDDHRALMGELLSIANKGIDWRPRYEKTLTERPWEECDCPICREFGIDVLIFRGNERNMRRGFHNVWQFYKLLHDESLHNKSKTLLDF